MNLLSRHTGRHVRHGSTTGWGGLALSIAAYAAHPVVDVATSCPALLRADTPKTPLTPGESR